MAQFSFPVVGTSLHEQADTFGAGRSGGRSHKGLDIFADEGAPVVAVRGGTVVKAGNSGGLGGIRAWVRDDDGNFHYYAHMSELNVRVGQRVGAGRRIGAVGTTGNARGTPPHLHYSVNPSGHTSESGSYNPFEYLRSNGAITAVNFEPIESMDSTTAAARRRQMREAGLNEFATDEEFVSAQERFVEGRRESTQTMADIFATVSEFASRRGGEVLDAPKMFQFGTDDEDENEDVEVA